jgi:uncharacterized protein (DUF169 family)
MDIVQIHDQAREIRELLCLKSHPLAIKMIKSAEEPPAGVKNPVKDLHCQMDLCQGFSMARWQGESLTMCLEDMWCIEPVIGLGLAEPPRDFFNGDIRYPGSMMERDFAKAWSSSFPRFNAGDYKGLVFSPLSACDFEPDLFIIYCDPSQLTHILLAQNCSDGRDISCKLSGHTACVYSIVPVLTNGTAVVVSPCRGDRRCAMARDYELIFAAPLEKLEGLIKAFRYLKEHGLGYPFGYELKTGRKLSDSYLNIGKQMGMHFGSKLY